ncbi:MAG: choice-of-anchor Q domain-containing protein [Candidatus Woesearchaeota archaeon]
MKAGIVLVSCIILLSACIYITPLGEDESSAPTGVPLPTPWTNTDVGGPSLEGSATYDQGIFTINASGSDIFGTQDEFHYAYQEVSGDFSIRARINSILETHGSAKASLMIRESLDAGSRHAHLRVNPPRSDGVRVGFQYRSEYEGSTVNGIRVTGYEFPLYLRLDRSGNTISGFVSTDGSEWTHVETLALATEDNVLVGLAATSHDVEATTTARFSDVMLESETPPFCGNGIVEAGEECDDGELNGVPCEPDEGSCTYCSSDCRSVTVEEESPAQTPQEVQLIELSQHATVHDGPFQLVHDRRASGGLAVNAPWKYETFGGTYPSQDSLSFSLEESDTDVSVWIRIYTHHHTSAGWRLELPGGTTRTVLPDTNEEYEWVEAYRGTIEGTQASLTPLGPRSSVDVVVISESRDPSGFDTLLDLPLPGPIPEARYYVSMSGSDSASGSSTDPFRTIQKAVDTAGPGDTILVREGRYGGFRILQKSGEPTNPITVQAYPGERVVLDAQLTDHDAAVIYISNPSQHWIFDGFEITDSNPQILDARALDIRDDDEYEQWQNMDETLKSDSMRAIRMLSTDSREYSSHLTFQNMEVHGMYETAFSGNANHLVFRNNHIHDNGYPGTSYGWYTSGDGVVWDGNIVHDVVRAIQSRTSGGPFPENMVAENNLFYRNGRFTWHHYSSSSRKGPAIVMVSIDGSAGNNAVRNNIFLYNGNGVRIQTPDGVVVHNTFIANGMSSSNSALSTRRDGAYVANNAFMDNSRDLDDRASTTQFEGNVETSQTMYRNPYKLDFSVVSGSPTINAGVQIPSVATDFFGTRRPQGSGWDAGAVERKN